MFKKHQNRQQKNVVVQVTRDFHADRDGYLTAFIGDTIFVIEHTHKKWWRGVHKGVVGFFSPENVTGISLAVA